MERERDREIESERTQHDTRRELPMQLWTLLGYENPGYWDFPGGPVVKNLPSSAGDAGSIPWSGS